MTTYYLSPNWVSARRDLTVPAGSAVTLVAVATSHRDAYRGIYRTADGSLPAGRDVAEHFSDWAAHAATVAGDAAEIARIRASVGEAYGLIDVLIDCGFGLGKITGPQAAVLA